MVRLKWIILAFGISAVVPVSLFACSGEVATGGATDPDCDVGRRSADGFYVDSCENEGYCADGQTCSVGCEETRQPICYTRCTSSNDCPSGNICNPNFCGGAFGRCEAACYSDDDCTGGVNLICDSATGICIKDEGFCTRDDECGFGKVCSSEGACVEEVPEACSDANDCASGQACSMGCQETKHPICFTQCMSHGDCPAGSVCNSDFCSGAFGRCEPSREGDCSANSDCAGDQVCNIFLAQCQDPCKSSEDCLGEGLVCNAATGMCLGGGGSCTHREECGLDEICSSHGMCVDANATSCMATEDCYDLGDFYCAWVGEAVCVNTACGVAFNHCTHCTLGANRGTKTQNGPLIFAAEQVATGSSSACQPNSRQCGEEGVKLFCKFSFHHFDPDGDFIPRNGNVFSVSGTGSHKTTFGVRELGSGIAEFGACFRDGTKSPGTAIFVRDAQGNSSNTICTEGVR